MDKAKLKVIRKKMIDKDLNQRSLAKICEVSEQFLGQLIAGRKTSARCADVISEALEIPRDRLIRLITK